ncbi:type VI secretion system baseplate subunit TssF [Massilia horti]|uniref:type VI secretion system baseplate subunit TssF n=1 Tax=Massilia horti TaxID=2562153 RepID=UPI001E47722F|nr:type VI secretion system baseplate subunit TssF [Massilia horti]
MDELLRYFEEELGLFGQYAREFRNRFPKPASDLHISGETYEDPSVARLIQSVAFMSARIRKRLDDDYPKFTESLLESLYPHYLRPLPSHTIVQIGNRGPSELLPEVRLLPRGTLVRSSGEQGAICFFRTVYDLTLAPIVLSKAEFSSLINAPRAAGLPRGVTSSVSIVIERGGDKVDLGDGVLDRLRLFVDGEPSLRAALIDALFMKTRAAFLQVNRDPAWLPLAKVPLRLAGFGDEDEMVPFPSRAHPAFRLLTEYFTYPEKFNFIDIDLSEIVRMLPSQCTRFTLHLALADVPSDSGEARLLSALSHKNLLLGCTPIINLFDKAGEPLQLAHTSAEYILCADSAHASSYEIHSVNQVRLVHGGHPPVTTEFGPLYSVDFERQTALAKRNYWITRRDETTAAVSPGHEMRIALIDSDFKPSQAAGATLSVELTCTNRDLPCQMRYGLPEGDMHTDGIPSSSPVRVLRRPSHSYRFDARQGAHWRLIAHLALNHARLTDAGLLDFQKMLSLYDLPRSAISQRLIKGIVGLTHGTVRAWIKTEPMSTLMPGIGIRMTVDEQAFVGSGIYVFAQVMERYFAMNSQLNCFTQLQIVSQQTGEEILTCPPRTAEQTRA